MSASPAQAVVSEDVGLRRRATVKPPSHACHPSRHSHARTEGSLWTCDLCGSGWHVQANGRWGRDGQDLRIEVPRLDKRFSLERCRATAQLAARHEGFIGPPDEVAAYESAAGSLGPLANPQGYVFTWYGPDSESCSG